MDGSRDEAVSEAVHRNERGGGGCVSEIVDKGSSRHRRTGRRFRRDDRYFGAIDLVQDKRKSQARKVTSASDTPGDHIHFFLSKFFQLLFFFESNDRLMHQDMAQHTSQGVTGVFRGDRIFNRFADGDSKASRGIGIL